MRGEIFPKTALHTLLLEGVVAFQMGCASSQSPPPSIPTPQPPSPPTPPSEPAEPSDSTSPPESTDSARGSEAAEFESESSSAAEQQGATLKETTEASESEAASTTGSSPSAGGTESVGEAPQGAPGGALTTGERQAGLDRELDQSLAEFDGLLLNEQEILEGQRQETAAAGAGGPGGGGPGADSLGGEESGGGEADGADPSESVGGATGGSPDSPAGQPEEDTSGTTVEGRGETDHGRVPPDVGDGSNDDIVARQLREAAEKEEDPELREKLWDEYRAYKSGLKKKD